MKGILPPYLLELWQRLNEAPGTQKPTAVQANLCSKLLYLSLPFLPSGGFLSDVHPHHRGVFTAADAPAPDLEIWGAE